MPSSVAEDEFRSSRHYGLPRERPAECTGLGFFAEVLTAVFGRPLSRRNQCERRAGYGDVEFDEA